MGSWWGAVRIEDDLTRRAQALLDASGAAAVVVVYAGRDATLRGEVADAQEAAAVVDAVSALTGTRSVQSAVEVAADPTPGPTTDGRADGATDAASDGASDGDPGPTPDVPTPSGDPSPDRTGGASDPGDPGDVDEADGSARTVVLFDVGRAELSAEARAALDAVVDRLAADPGLRLAVEGHTDDVGSLELNERLSRDRADAVASYLVAAGVDQDRLDVGSFADTRPVATNDTDEGRAANRRVELRATEESG